MPTSVASTNSRKPRANDSPPASCSTMARSAQALAMECMPCRCERFGRRNSSGSFIESIAARHSLHREIAPDESQRPHPANPQEHLGGIFPRRQLERLTQCEIAGVHACSSGEIDPLRLESCHNWNVNRGVGCKGVGAVRGFMLRPPTPDPRLPTPLVPTFRSCRPTCARAGAIRC